MIGGALEERLSRLEKRHKDLKAQVDRLERRAYLTPDERRQITNLKKLKLNAKDQIHALRRQL